MSEEKVVTIDDAVSALNALLASNPKALTELCFNNNSRVSEDEMSLEGENARTGRRRPLGIIGVLNKMFATETHKILMEVEYNPIRETDGHIDRKILRFTKGEIV